ncbi:hypothetical protein ACN38_g5520 [Penicillium nordicum]|uniref:Uncharacterized protein n=1 Tax=Penicillium nordicum TaxID=229535 RepID=A0A0M8P9N0_9EURO|nr:hypothetical protein ACN38_g5520 [Penicillium nordicum]
MLFEFVGIVWTDPVKSAPKPPAPSLPLSDTEILQRRPSLSYNISPQAVSHSIYQLPNPKPRKSTQTLPPPPPPPRGFPERLSPLARLDSLRLECAAWLH